jgi:hypothetical protein
MLVRDVFDRSAGEILPAGNPAPAKVAIAVEEEDGLPRRDGDFSDADHGGIAK